MATISQKQLRDNVAEFSRRAEADEEFTITVSGRPVAELGPIKNRRRWVPSEELTELWEAPPDPTLMRELEGFGDLQDPWEPRDFRSP